MALGLTVRMNAARHDITTEDGDGGQLVVDMSQLTKPETRKVRRMVRSLFEKQQQKEAA